MDSRPDTEAHIEQVDTLLRGVAAELCLRGRVHDASKLEPPEKEIFDEVTEELSSLTYGSDEYKASLAEMGPALEHHYEVNSHHPEHGERDRRWLPVVGFEGRYEVSDLGEVKSLHTGELMSAHVNAFGYPRLQLAADGTKTNKFVHVLVAEAFVANPEGKPEVNHRDGQKTNNNAVNLEWVTRGENVRHSHETGLVPSTAKYAVECPELDLVTIGSTAMARKLRESGYPGVESAGILRAAETGGTHLGLGFETMLLVGHRRSRLDAMNLLDVVEMLCDWIAASRRHANGDIHRSIDLNAERFGYGEELRALLHNSVEPVEALQISLAGAL